ncbi:carboxymuconolactone decarboxylase family protein [Wenyingzhuangia sp. IMCC45574]
MSTLQIHNIETATEASKEQLKESIKAFGMIPNLHGVLANSPETLRSYKFLHEQFQQTSFDKEELNVVWQSINVEHGCGYCVPAHTAIAGMMKVNPELTEALRNQESLQTKKLQVLQATTLSIVRNRGRISDEELEVFYEVGYDEQQVVEILLGLAQKTISNYVNHIASTPVDAPFQKFAWKKETTNE